MTERRQVSFDDYADAYEDLLKKQLGFFSKDRDYFSDYKARIAAKQCGNDASSILDFGCGVGLNLPSLAQYFPRARLFATDPSEKSLARVAERHANVLVLRHSELAEHRFEVIFVAGVFHHVPIEHRESVVRQLAALLTERGRLIVFEHNPFNPVTRYLVSTCPFDKDAKLLTRSRLKRLLMTAGGLRVISARYCLFFPESMRRLHRLEEKLAWLPLGGQYYVVSGR